MTDLIRSHRRLRRLAAGITAVALLLQAFMPITALAAAAARADLIQLCTAGGIVWVSLAGDKAGVQVPAKNHAPDCPLCPACPHCPASGGVAMLPGGPDAVGRVIVFEEPSFTSAGVSPFGHAASGAQQPRAPPPAA